MPRPISDAAYTAVRERWHAALHYIRTMDQTRTIDNAGVGRGEARHLQLVRAADAYDQTTRVYRAQTIAAADRQTVAASILDA